MNTNFLPKGLKITSILPETPGQRLGLAEGDRLLAVNGIPVADPIDVNFLQSEPRLDLRVVTPGGQERFLRVVKHEDDDLGLRFEPMKFKSCKNKCVFCFVDQNPRGMRRGTYFKDEDYRLSFLYGNYVTLTNVTDEDLERIVRQRLSPLYVSIHSMDREERDRLLGVKAPRDINEVLPWLIERRVEVHGQFVICPGWNDGERLKQSLEKLAKLFPGCGSAALVPLGMTQHREGLPPLKAVTPAYAGEFIDFVEPLAREFDERLGQRFAYCSDEWYLIAGRPVPGVEIYGDLPQLTNGVGLVSKFLHDWNLHRARFRPQEGHARRVTIGTGVYGQMVLEPLLHTLQEEAPGLKVEVAAIQNRWYGPSIRVAGLLPAEDIIAGLEGRDLGDEVLLPEVMVHYVQGRFLDGMTPSHIEQALGVPVRIVDTDAGNLLRTLLQPKSLLPKVQFSLG